MCVYSLEVESGAQLLSCVLLEGLGAERGHRHIWLINEPERTESQNRGDVQAAAISGSIPKGNGSVSFKAVLSQILFIKADQ